MAQHTPGPWEYCKANPEQGCSCGLVWSKSSDCVVAEVIFKDEDHTKPHEVVVANAKLIAAAPELLEACQRLLAWCKDQCDLAGSNNIVEGDYAIVLRAAIAKATKGGDDGKDTG